MGHEGPLRIVSGYTNEKRAKGLAIGVLASEDFPFRFLLLLVASSALL